MNILPTLLHRLERFARNRDERGVANVIDQLGRNAGWADEVSRFIARMDGLDRALVENVLAPSTTAPPSLGTSTWQPKTTLATPISIVATKDATSNVYVPASSTEWASVLAAASIASGGPSSLYGCQEASGNLTDAIGGLTLTVTGTPLYQQTVTGWSRKAVQTADASSQAWSTTSASLPDISTTSFLALFYLNLQSAPSAQHILTAMGTTAGRIQVSTASKPMATSASNTSTGATSLTTSVVPVVLKVDRTNSVVAGYTLADKMIPTFSGTMTGKKFVIGPDSASVGCAAQYLYCANFVGAAAELTDAQVKTLLQTLGWVPTWS